MANYVGVDAAIEVGVNAIGELKNANITITGDEVDTTTFGAAGRAKTRRITLREASLELSGFLDPDNTGQATLLSALHAASNIGEIAALSVYPFGKAAGTAWSGAWVISNANIPIAFDGVVEVSMSLKSNGAITYTP